MTATALPADAATADVAERIERIGVVGCGTMGAGIAELCAARGLDVVFVELDDAAVEAGRERIVGSLDRSVRRGRMTQDERDAAAARITGSTDFGALGDRQLIVEAVPERLELKQSTFAKVDAAASDDCIIATNTSSLPVMDIAVHTRRPNRVIGFHFFNPAPVMKLIELVRTFVTDDNVVQAARGFAESIGKEPVVVGDRRGFIANQLLFPYINQAISLVESGYATKEDVDTAMRLGTGHPMGPIMLADLVGLDTMVGIMDAIHDDVADKRFAPRPILSQLVAAGHVGRKAGRGFYAYAAPGSRELAPEEAGTADADPALVAGWQRVGVVGSGTMAAGIAEVCAKAGYDVALRARTQAKAETAVARVAASLQRMVDKERMSAEDMDATLARIHPTAELADLADSDVVVEAVAEDLEVKRELLAELSPMLGDDAVVTTTTSSLPVVECAMVTERPDRVVGLHFFNPAAIMQLVEVVPTVRTDPEVLARARAFVRAVGKVDVRCGDRAGFIVNALLFPYLNDAVKMLASHYATAEEIDKAMVLGCGHPMGPFALMDIVGLDVTLAIVRRLHREFREPSFAPAPLLEHLVDVGFLGRKAGRGFYTYA